MSSSVEIRFQVQCRGVLLIRFDYVVGPVVEELFPRNFIPDELLWNLALDIWMSMGSKSMEKGYNTIVFLREVGMFACLVSGGNGEKPYAMAALFDPENVSGLWSARETIVDILLEHVEKARTGNAAHVVIEAYDNLVKSLGKTRASEAFLDETADFILNLTSAIQSLGREAGGLRGLVKSYIERVADEVAKLGSEKTIKKFQKALSLLGV